MESSDIFMNQDDIVGPLTFQESSPCPYFRDGRESSIEYLIPDDYHEMHFHEYLAGGYRRFGRVFYRNVCAGCGECLPLRIETARFKADKGQRKVLRLNSDLLVRVVSPPFLTDEKVALYKNYLLSKHGGSVSEPPRDYENDLCQIHYGYYQTLEMEYFCEGRLMAVGIVDAAADALSSNYFYYDTDFLDRRPGVFSVLRKIELAEAMGKKYYCLGFYIKDISKMAYKRSFCPHQVYENGCWVEFHR